MKKIILLCLAIYLVIGSCTQKLPLEGAWKLIGGQWFYSDNKYYQFPGNIYFSQIKIFTKDYFDFVGQYKIDTMIIDNYGGGTYKIQGTRFEEEIIYHSYKASIGKKIRILMDIHHDTLIQRWPADDNWKLYENYSTEKYIRIK